MQGGDLYARLGVSNSAEEGEIKRAYRALALKHHPDKGGDAELFKSLSEAYAVRSGSHGSLSVCTMRPQSSLPCSHRHV